MTHPLVQQSNEFLMVHGFFLLFMLAVITAAAIALNARHIADRLKITKTTWLLLCLTTLIGLILRVFHQHGYGLENAASDYVGYALQYLNSGKLNFMVHPPGLSFIFVMIIKIFGSNYNALLYSSIAAGTAAITGTFIFVYLLTREELYALLTSLSVALYPGMITISGLVWRDVYVLLFSIMTLISFVYAIRTNTLRAYVMVSSVFCCALLIDMRAGILAAPMLAMAITKKHVSGVATSLGISLLLLSPIIVPVWFENKDAPTRDPTIFGSAATKHYSLYSIDYIPKNINSVSVKFFSDSWLFSLLFITGLAVSTIRGNSFLLMLGTGLFVSLLAASSFWGFYYWGATDTSLLTFFYLGFTSYACYRIWQFLAKTLHTNLPDALAWLSMIIILGTGSGIVQGLSNPGGTQASEIDFAWIAERIPAGSYLLVFNADTKGVISLTDLAMFLAPQAKIVVMPNFNKGAAILIEKMQADNRVVYFVNYNSRLLNEHSKETNIRMYEFMNKSFELNKTLEKKGTLLLMVGKNKSTAASEKYI